MYPPARFLAAVFACAASTSLADDIRAKVGPAAGPPASDMLIDTQGTVFGLPFGTSEDGVIEKFGQPSGSGVLVGPGLNVTEVSVGDMAPDFAAKTTEGETIKLGEWKGAPVLVNFTATWCPPCKVETLVLAATYARYRGQGLKIISVYLDDPSRDVFAYAKTLGAVWPINTDGKIWDNAVAQTYGVSEVPGNVLVGKDGKILSTNARGPQLDILIEDALK